MNTETVARTEDDRKLRVVTGAALSEAIAELAAQVGPAGSFGLIAALWKNLPAEAVDGIVHQAAVKVGPVDRRETFADYRFTPSPPVSDTTKDA